MAPLEPLDSCGIMLSYRCQCGCRHCVYACGPRWQGWMSREQLEALLLGLRETWENPRGLHLAGGEPFLNFDLLLWAVERCRRYGLPMEYVETNAGWCTSYEEAREKFRLLREAGLSRILISCSPFHAETVPLRRTLTAYQAAREVFGPQGVILYMARFVDLIRALDTDRPVPLKRWLEAYGLREAGRLFWEGYQLFSGGRAGFELGALTARYPWEAFRGLTCSFEILSSRHAHFDPYGNYIPLFCGGLSLGTVGRDLPAFVARYDPEGSPIVKLLVQEGPFGLAEWAKKEFGFRPDPRGYAGKCHLCVATRAFLAESGEEFPELSPRDFYRNLRSHLPALEVDHEA